MGKEVGIERENAIAENISNKFWKQDSDEWTEVELKLLNFKVRCSAISKVLSESRDNPCLTEKQAGRLLELRGKDGLTVKQDEELKDLIVKEGNSQKTILSDTCIDYLTQEYAWIVHNKTSVTKDLMDIPAMQKGIIVEPQSIKLICKVTGTLVKANHNEETGEKDRVYNDFFSGEVDAFVGDQIIGASEIDDAKSIWDEPTYLAQIKKKISIDQEWQLKGYGDISGAKDLFVSKCLINTPEHIVEGIKYRLLTKFNCATEEAPEFKRAWSIIERSMYFNDIPEHQRLFRVRVEPMTPTQQTRAYDRVKACRQWLLEFHKWFSKLNK